MQMDKKWLRRHAFFIDGEWQPTAAALLQVVSPATEQVIGEAPLAMSSDIDRAVSAAHAAFANGPWPRTTQRERADVLTRAADMLRKRAPDIAAITVEEMGCAVSQAQRSQTGLVAPVFDYYAQLLSSFELVQKLPQGGELRELPVGVVAAIVPWNAPVTLAAWKIAPALAAGCCIVLKPPPEAPLSNFILAEALQEAGVPRGVINVLPGDRAAGEHLIAHPLVDKVAFTGSTAAGKRILTVCAEQLKRVSLELGGKSAVIVLEDANLPDVVARTVRAAMHLSGQFCGAQSRVLVPRARYAELVEVAAATAAAIPVGDPHDPATVIGPLVAARQRSRVLDMIADAARSGARIAAGGGRPKHLPKGYYVEPTVLADVDNSMPIAQEEIFGPVVCLIPYDNEADAVRIANDSRYGLTGAVWSADDQRALTVARQLRTGSATVNGFPAPFPHAPFGGFKQSGLGRELGPHGLRSYLEPQSLGVPPSLRG
jgi:acyl-CoA reductase-like NAD-dependent aldehyde dehydrogenase